MDNQITLANHEMLELHELLRSNIADTKKLESTLGMVQDPQLASFIQDSVNAARQKMREIQQFINSNKIVQ